MSERTAAELIDAYTMRLRAELSFLGAADTDDFVAEIRSLLIDASGDDPVRAALEIAKIGDPSALAASVLAEKGLAPTDGMSTAEWWRMGIAVPLDIVIGLAVPVSVGAFALMLVYGADPSLAAAMYVLIPVAAGLVWSWFVWQPWRTGGPRRTAGMAVTGLALVRAPGFRRVVRSSELAAAGLRPAGGTAFAIASVVAAVLMLGVVGSQLLSGPAQPKPSPIFERAAGPVATQSANAKYAVERFYDRLLAGEPVQMEHLSGFAPDVYEALATRAKTEKLSSYKAGTPTRVSVGAWTVPVQEITSVGTHDVTFFVTLQITLQPGKDDVYGYNPSWVIWRISGDGIPATP